MEYLGEFRREWRALVGAFLGMFAGFSLFPAITSNMGPFFIKEFHWSAADFTLVGFVSIILWVFIPIAGRMADTLGVRRTAAIGVGFFPIGLIGLSLMTGDIRQYLVLFIALAIICITATATVYSRVVVERFQQARGLALGIAVSGSAISGMISGPVLNDLAHAYGWRTTLHIAAAVIFTLGVIALLLIPPSKPRPSVERRSFGQGTKQDYGIIFRHPAFYVLIGALLLVNLSQVLQISNLSLVMLAQGVSAESVGFMTTAFYAGMFSGRIISGLALDRFPGHIVAFVGMMLPSIGLFIIASNLDSFWVLAVAILLIGLSFGSEGDVVAYLVSRIFPVSVYSSVQGLMTAAISIATSLGTAILYQVLKATPGNYDVFLYIAGTGALVGSLLFFLLPRAARMANAKGIVPQGEVETATTGVA